MVYYSTDSVNLWIALAQFGDPVTDTAINVAQGISRSLTSIPSQSTRFRCCARTRFRAMTQVVRKH